MRRKPTVDQPSLLIVPTRLSRDPRSKHSRGVTQPTENAVDRWRRLMRDELEHNAIKIESRSLPANVLAAIGRPLRHIPRWRRRAMRDINDDLGGATTPWTNTCTYPGCDRTSIYKTDRCSDHPREEQR